METGATIMVDLFTGTGLVRDTAQLDDHDTSLLLARRAFIVSFLISVSLFPSDVDLICEDFFFLSKGSSHSSGVCVACSAVSGTVSVCIIAGCGLMLSLGHSPFRYGVVIVSNELVLFISCIGL